MAAGTDIGRPMHLFESAMELYEPDCAVKASLAAFQLGRVQVEAKLVTEAIVSRRHMKVHDSEELLQKARYLEGRIAEAEGQLQSAGELYTEALTCCSRSDPAIHEDCLQRLHALFTLNGLPTASLLDYAEEWQVARMDVVLLLGGSSTVPLALEVFDSLLHVQDRVAAVTSEGRVLFSLTEKAHNTRLLRHEIARHSDCEFRPLDALQQVCGELCESSEAPMRRKWVVSFFSLAHMHQAEALFSQARARLAVVDSCVSRSWAEAVNSDLPLEEVVEQLGRCMRAGNSD